MQWDSGPNAGFSTAPADRLYAPVVDDAVFGWQRVNVAALRADTGSLWHTLRKLLSVRKEHPAFGQGSFEFLECENRSILSVLRTFDGETILAVHNLSSQSQPVQLDLRRWRGMHVRDLLSEQVFPSVSDDVYALTLQPYQYAWLVFGHR
jgi:maltose alpha-D-glucosyltransferase/alpha-amylase